MAEDGRGCPRQPAGQCVHRQSRFRDRLHQPLRQGDAPQDRRRSRSGPSESKSIAFWARRSIAFHKDARAVEKILTTPEALPHQTEFASGTSTLEARINSIPDADGKVLGYVVAWEDVTYRQRLELDYAGQIAAIQRSQAVIEFELDGTIIHANEIFLKTMGYTLEEVKGKRHSHVRR